MRPTVPMAVPSVQVPSLEARSSLKSRNGFSPGPRLARTNEDPLLSGQLNCGMHCVRASVFRVSVSSLLRLCVCACQLRAVR